LESFFTHRLTKMTQPDAPLRRIRPIKHKAGNLVEHCPAHARAEMQRDYDHIRYAKEGLAARGAYDAFVTKWSKLCPPVARSLEEAGLGLLTFYAVGPRPKPASPPSRRR
jgi:transposase-like protein